MAKFTVSQIKELLELHESTLLKIFNDKFEKIENKLISMQVENTTLKTEISELKKSAEFINEKYEKILNEVNDSKKKASTSNLNKTSIEFEHSDNIIKDKLAELEDRSRRNNLRFNGIQESENETWEESEKKIHEILNSRLGINNNIIIERAHRTGKLDYGGKMKNRTIVVKFLNYKDKQTIMENYLKLKLWTERLNINEDYCERTTELRKKLFIEAKELRTKGKYAKVVYNKLVTRDA
ncbi:uncharacterized protein LOC136096680 [Hydra vulgaris]|uniref:uncharacterized protein LOC136096680 n=1 Tax=Hydra vulgaris TaxID=6087 RepID=UPI0032EA692E